MDGPGGMIRPAAKDPDWWGRPWEPINVNDDGRIEGWQDGATVAWITMEITRRDGTTEWWAREYAPRGSGR